MRAFVPSQVPNDLDPRLVKILRDMSGYLEQVDKGFGAVQRGASPVAGGGGGVTLLIDHHKLVNLATYDDHPQYAYLPGRADGQTLYGATTGTITGGAGTWVNAGDFTSKNSKVATASWSGIAIDTSAAVGDIIILQLTTLSFIANANGVSNNHATITDTKGNTWTKLREYQYSDNLQNGPCTSIWTCTVTSALSAGSDTLTATFVASIGAMGISAHRFLMVGVTAGTPVIAGLAFLGEQGFVGSEPSALTISGLESSVQYLFVRFNSEGNIGSNVVGPLSGSASYTAFNNGTSFTTGGSGNAGAFPEFRILSATSDLTNPTMGASGGYFVSIYVAFAAYPTQTVGLTLQGSPLPNSAKIELIGQPLRLYGRNIGFRDVGGTSDLSYVRATDGGLIDKLVMASESVTDPSTPLILRGYDDGPIVGTNAISSRSGEVRVDQAVKVLADYLLVAERSTDYGISDGFHVATGLGFVNVNTKGGETITGHASASGSPLIVDQGNAGLTVVTSVFRKRLSQTGDLTEWQDSTSAVMSYIRASDGAFVGPVVTSGTDTHPDNIFKILGSGDPTKIVMFEVDGLTTATTRTITVPDVSATLILTQGTSAGQVIGTSAHTGGSASSLVIEGPVMIGSGVTSFPSGRSLNIQHPAANGATIVNIQPDITGLSGAASGNITGMQIAISSAFGYTSGTFGIRGFFFVATGVIPSGVTCSEAIGGIFQTTPSTSGTGAITKQTGLRLIVSAPNTATTVPTLFGLDVQISTRLSTVSTIMSHITLGSSAAWSGTATTYVGIDFGTTAAADVAGTGAFTGIRIPAVTNPTGTIWGIDCGSPSQFAALTVTGDITLNDAKNLSVGSTTGTVIATATSQKIGFWNAAPNVQPTTGITAATFVANTSGIVDDSATFDGYTIGQVVAALRREGLLA